MTSKHLKRGITFLFVLIMGLSRIQVALAEENNKKISIANNTVVGEYFINVNEEGEISCITDKTETNTLENEPETDFIQPNSFVILRPKLDSYIGFTKNFIVNATSESNTGLLFIYLYDPDGNIKSNDWIMGVNQLVRCNVFLPKSGTWTVHLVAQGTTAGVDVYVRWE